MIWSEGKLVAPERAIPIRLNNRATVTRVSDTEVQRMRTEQPTRFRITRPFPGRPEDRHALALEVAPRDIDDELLDLTLADGFKVLSNRVNVPVPNQLAARLNQFPRLPDEIPKRAIT